MRCSNLVLVLLALGAVACGKSGRDEGSATTTVEANLDAENFSTTLNSDDAAMNESDIEQLNGSNGA